MKAIAPLILIGLLFVAALAGCSGSAKEDPAKGPTNTAAPQDGKADPTKEPQKPGYQ